MSRCETVVEVDVIQWGDGPDFPTKKLRVQSAGGVSNDRVTLIIGKVRVTLFADDLHEAIRRAAR